MARHLSRRGFFGLSAGVSAALATACTASRSATHPDPTGTDSTGGTTGSTAATGPSGSSGSSGRSSTRSTGGGDRDEAETTRTGNRNWNVVTPGPPEAVQGYASAADILPGEAFDLFVSSTSTTVDIEAFRMGWYHGVLARRVWSRAGVRVGKQPKATVNAHLNTVTAPWHRTLTVRTGGWPEGAYVLRLTSEHGQRYVPLILRSADARGKVLLVHATATWQAYNTWGGHSLYQGPGGTEDYANRSRVVSFDRPYDGSGADKFIRFERQLVALCDQLKIPVAYTTSAHVHNDPKLLASAAAVISLGHDEYWTPQMRANVTAARDKGVNVAFLGANACFRRIRFENAGAAAHRHVVCYKTDYATDPAYKSHREPATHDFRQHPDYDPECTLTGAYYEAWPTAGAYTVHTPDSWLFAGTGVKKGTKFPNLIGPEYDRVNPIVALPRPMQVLAHSPTVCKGIKTYSDSAYYTTRSGAGVFNSGTMNWCRAVHSTGPAFTAQTADFVTRVTANLLEAFKDGPAAHKFPAHDNLAEIKPYKGDPTFDRHNLW